MGEKNKKNDSKFIHNDPFNETHSPFSRFEEKILPKIVWISFIIAFILIFVLLILSINPILAILPLGLWFIFFIIAEAFVMKK
jgi:hypothetical protein